MLEHFFGISDVDDAKSFFLLVFMTWICGLLSGIGCVLAIVDFWYVTKAMREDIAGVDYFFLIASSQVGLYFCSSIFLHNLSQTWPVSALGLVVFGSLWFGSVALRRRREAATLARMEREGEEFRQELRERNLERNLKWGRRRR